MQKPIQTLSKQAQFIKNAQCIIIKVGSAVLTNDHGLDIQILENIVDQIAYLHKQGHKVCLVSSGAVAAGKMALEHTHYKIEGLAGKQGAAAIGQSRLMRAYEDAFARHNLICAQILLTRDDLRSRERFLNAKNTFLQLLQWDTIPIVNENDTVVIRELKFGDNDSLASLLANLIEANLSINLTSTKGVLAENPLTSSHTHIPILSTIENIETLDLNSLCGGKTSVGTGGMYSKLLSAKRTAQLGVPTLILPGKEKDIIQKAFEDVLKSNTLKNEENKNKIKTKMDIEKSIQNSHNTQNSIGTWVFPCEKHLSRRKYWLAYQSEPQGSISIDMGAKDALTLSGKSLLPAGITEVDGNFGVGTLVKILFENSPIAVGLCNYSAIELRKIKGLKRLEVAATLGNAHYPEVIHRDNLILNATT